MIEKLCFVSDPISANCNTLGQNQGFNQLWSQTLAEAKSQIVMIKFLDPTEGAQIGPQWN